MSYEEELAAVQAEAQRLLNGRLEIVAELKGAESAEREAELAVQSARTTKATVWARALKAGWSESELLRLGFKKPTVKAPGRPAGSGTKKSKKSAAIPAPSAGGDAALRTGPHASSSQPASDTPGVPSV
ncbi:hypothetical protein [Streptomyces sp. NPDC018045]|uniref:hypothetical protein n=1 Tax=Streptomyces sp. NPDC018045 TaxID=3365037 RepID=UPI0037BCE92E